MSKKSLKPLAPLGGLRRRAIQVNVPVDAEPLGPVWTFPGAGSAKDVQVPTDELAEIRDSLSTKRHQLGEWPATAICGNDILSSVLYSSGIVTAKAGKFAPIPLLLVAAVLYFFRFIYEEVVTAIPLNGGSYNVLLNTTSKRVASFGAALGIISYLATGVVSSASGVSYLDSVVGGLPKITITIALLLVFAILSFFGVTESSRVALCIFMHHVVVLTVLSVSSFIYVVQNTHIFSDNMHSELPKVDFAGDLIDSNVFTAIFFGFGAAMLGITGFESSAQFVEEQKPGVFRKTLRNMWGFVTAYNTVLIFMALGVMPVESIVANKDFLLAEMGDIVIGHWFKVWIAADALIVLSGAVLTSYVGITGLVRRLSSDRVLPAFLMTQNKWRGTNHWIILAYFLIASSFVLILNADTTVMSGVYTYAFLSLMALFSFGCMVLKTKRAEIPRDIHAPWWSCIMGFSLVIVGIFSNLLGDPKVLMYFALYLIAVVFVMMCMLDRVPILKLTLAAMKSLMPSRSRAQEFNDRNARLSPSRSDYELALTPPQPSEEDTTLDVQTIHTGARGGRTIAKAIIGINESPIIFFCKYPDMTLINKAILYVRRNEQTHNLRIVHVSEAAMDGGESGGSSAGSDSSSSLSVRKEFENVVALFDCIYPKLRVDFVHVHGEFEPAVVKWLSESLRVPVNLMFIAQPGDKAVHSVSKLGVRVITG